MPILREVNTPYTVNADDSSAERDTIIIRRNGEPVWAVVPYTEYQELQTMKQRLSHSSAPNPEFEKQWQALQARMPQLLKTHLGQWVAIVDQQMVSAGATWESVLDDVLARFGNVPMCIHEVLEKPHIYKIESPRIIRREV